MVERRRTIGRAVDECVRDSTEEWFRQHRGYRTREEALSEDIRLVSATVERRPGGRLEVFVGIVTKDRRTTTQDWYKYQQSGELGYVRNDGTKAVG